MTIRITGFEISAFSETTDTGGAAVVVAAGTKPRSSVVIPGDFGASSASITSNAGFAAQRSVREELSRKGCNLEIVLPSFYRFVVTACIISRCNGCRSIWPRIQIAISRDDFLGR